MAIKQAGAHAPILALTLVLAPSISLAQGQPKAPAKEGKAAEEAAQPAEGEEAAEGEEGEGEGEEGEGEGEEGEGEGEEGEGGTEALGLDALCKIDPENCVKIDMEEYAKRDVKAEMYAVQQIWALRARRVELNLPYAVLTMNDQFVAHPGIGGAINYYIINPLAIGVNGNYYFNTISDFNFETSRAARIGQPLTEYQFTVNGNLTYVPAYGKFAAFGNFIFHYDLYVLIGGGIISTRPIAVVDPDNRTFEFKIRPTWGFGGGIRIFFTRWLAANLEIRDYMFLDELENPNIATGFDPATGELRAQDESTWLSEDLEFTNNVQAQLGLSFFLPPSWEYKLPK